MKKNSNQNECLVKDHWESWRSSLSFECQVKWYYILPRLTVSWGGNFPGTGAYLKITELSERVQLQCRLGSVLFCYFHVTFVMLLIFHVLFQFIYLFASATTLLLKTIFLNMHAVMRPSVMWVLDKTYIISAVVFHNLSSWNWLIFFKT